jgi:hypothetical protein
MRRPLSTQFNRENTECFTPAWVVKLLVPYLLEQGFKKIWTPFDEEHSEFVRVLQENHFEVHYTHIATVQDFFIYQPDFEFDVIVSNPPFKDKGKFIDRALEFGKPVCFLLSMFSLQKNFLKHHNRLNFLILKNRVEFTNVQGKLPCAFLCFDFVGLKDRAIDSDESRKWSFETKHFTPFNKEVIEKLEDGYSNRYLKEKTFEKSKGKETKLVLVYEK